MSAFDLVVIGAGPAGATAALTAARAGLTVAIVEKCSFPRRKVCGEFISATTWPLLRRLGVAPALLAAAGPPVTRVGFYAGQAVVHAPMPETEEADAWGRALGREHLDAELLDAAIRTGARAWQPWSASACDRFKGRWRVRLEGLRGRCLELEARVLVNAQGSWQRDALSPAIAHAPRRASDLFGFKAHFRASRLPAGSMPLVVFPGGYGGLVASDSGRTSFSLCIRRDALAACRSAYPGQPAGEAVLAHVMASTRGVREALGQCPRDGAWLSAGPIRPGVRRLAGEALLVAGNAAGEAHPLVAEGISMAIQSGWLAAHELASAGSLGDAGVEAACRRYARAWRENFATRVRVSSGVAALMLAPAARDAAMAVISAAPAALTWGARASGKAAALRAVEAFP